MTTRQDVLDALAKGDLDGDLSYLSAAIKRRQAAVIAPGNDTFANGTIWYTKVNIRPKSLGGKRVEVVGRRKTNVECRFPDGQVRGCPTSILVAQPE